MTKPRPNRGFVSWLDAIDEDSMYISVLTVGEIQQGISRLERGSPKRAALERWLVYDLIARFGRRILPFDLDVARHWGNTVASALDRGVILGIVDSQIAATASLFGLKVVTRNLRHFVPTGVPTVNPWTR
jgi:hypothetical protein